MLDRVPLTSDLTSSSKLSYIKKAASHKFLWPGYRPEKNVFKIKMLMQH